MALLVTCTTTASVVLPGRLAALTCSVVEGAGGDAAGGVVEVAVQQLLALEAGRAGDAVDGAQDRVDLKLVGRDFVGAQAAGVGRLADQALELVQQVADFVQATFGGADDVAGAVGVVDGLV